MKIPLIIGKNSNGEDQSIDLVKVPLLMVSYCEETQINEIFHRIQDLQYPNKPFNYLITNTRRLSEWKIGLEEAYVFLRDEPNMGNVKSRVSLLQMINQEIQRRQRLLAQYNMVNFNRYVSLNLWNQQKLNYCFLLIDDIWDIVTAKPKSIVLSLINIFINGPAMGIHAVFSSSISYRNLLDQLVTINPKIRLQLQKKYGIPEPKKINLLGSELIFTPDELIFYKPYGTMNMERLFKS